MHFFSKKILMNNRALNACYPAISSKKKSGCRYLRYVLSLVVMSLFVVGTEWASLTNGIAAGESGISPLYRSWRTLVVATTDDGHKGLQDPGGNWVFWGHFDDMRPFLNHKLISEKMLTIFRRRYQSSSERVVYNPFLHPVLDRIFMNGPSLPVKMDGEWFVFIFQQDGLPAPYGPFPEGLIPCGEFSKSGFINPDGEWVIGPQYAYVEQFSEGLALVGINDPNMPDSHSISKKDLLFGYIDISGKMVIAPRHYGEIPGNFNDGLACVNIVEKDGGDFVWGYIDRKGGFAFRPHYKTVGPFYRGLACVMYQDTFWYNFFYPLNSCLGSLIHKMAMGLLPSNRNGYKAFDVEWPDVYAVIDHRGHELYRTKNGWEEVYSFIRKKDPEWFN